MKIQVPTTIEKDLKYLVAYIPKYRIHEENFENESTEFLNALRQTYGTFDKSFSPNSYFSKRNHENEVSRLVIDIDNGRLIGWERNSSGEIYIKVVDEGLYQFYDSDFELIKEHDGSYVPPELQISDEGYGDYVCFKVDDEGFIIDWEKGKYEIESRFLF